MTTVDRSVKDAFIASFLLYSKQSKNYIIINRKRINNEELTIKKPEEDL